MRIRSPAKKKASGQDAVALWEKYRATQQQKAAKGGKARAAKLSAKELSDQGRKAVQARWAKVRASKRSKS